RGMRSSGTSGPFARRRGRGAALAGRCLILRNTPLQRLHEVARSPGRRKCWPFLPRRTGLFGLQVRDERLLLAVAEGFWVEIYDLALQDLRGKREHVGGERQLRQLGE